VDLNNNVRRMIADYAEGDTLEEIGRRYGMSKFAVRTRLLAAGVRLRPPGRRPAGAMRGHSAPMGAV
jgi:DNA-directed RNA polymerase sigma subunit (sigma70/sigma32)